MNVSESLHIKPSDGVGVIDLGILPHHSMDKYSFDNVLINYILNYGVNREHIVTLLDNCLATCFSNLSNRFSSFSIFGLDGALGLLRDE